MSEVVIKSAIGHSKLSIEGEPTEEGKVFKSRMFFDMYKGHPRITVWSQHPNEADKKGRNNIEVVPLHTVPISVRTSIIRLKAVLYKMLNSIGTDDNKPWINHFKALTVSYDDRGVPDLSNKILQSTVAYGRDKEGYLFFVIKEPNREKVKFRIKEDSFHVGDEYSNPAEESNFISVAYLNTVMAMLDSGFEKTYDSEHMPWKKKTDKEDKAS